MKAVGHIATLAAARFYAPLIVFAALVALALAEPGAGAGLLVGLLFAAALAAHLLVFGANAARAALPPLAGKALLSLGLAATLLGAAAPRLPGAAMILEAGLFAATAAGAALVLAALAGRAPTLRDEG